MLEPWLVKFIVVSVVVAWFLTTVISLIVPTFQVPPSLTGVFVAIAGAALTQVKKDPPDSADSPPAGREDQNA